MTFLAGCTPETSPEVGSTATPAPTTSASIAPNVVLDPDIVLYVSATATDANGVAADISLRLHSSTRWSDDDDSAAIRPEFIGSACAGDLSPVVFSAEEWSFALADISAVVATGSWPSGAVIGVLPTADIVPIASGGIIISDPAAAATDVCAANKEIGGTGDGTLVLGLTGDSAGASPLTAWTDLRYGFSTGSDFTLSNCVYLVTTTGQAAGGSGNWASTATEEECSVSHA